jgi:Apea-like HEPN
VGHTTAVEPPDPYAPDPRPRPVIDKQVAVEARKFLTAALAEYRRLGVIPKMRRGNRWDAPENGPWPYWGAWYDIENREAGVADFVAALRTAYPARFGEISKFPFKDPEEYVRAFLNAVVAAGIVAEGRVSARSRATTAMLHELHRAVSQDGQMWGVLWLIDDVKLSAVDRQKVGVVTLLRPGSSPELLVSRLLPGALWSSDRHYPGGRRSGLLWASGRGPGHHWDVTTPLNNGIGRFTQALRLATATTSVERMVWLGEPTMIHTQFQEAWPQTEVLPMDTHWRRVATLTPDHLPGLRRLTATMDRLEAPPPAKQKKGALPSIVIAIRRYSRSHRISSWQDTVLELATALEACLGPSDKRQEIGLTLRTRAAHLLAHDDSEQAETIYKDLTDLYNMRSDIIHGNATWTRTPDDLWADRGYGHIFETDRTNTLLDRWRDILRRAIAARLLLADPDLDGGALWPLKGQEPVVDRLLVRRDVRDRWHSRIVEGAAAYGLPLLASAAPPLIDYLHNDPDDRANAEASE